VRLLSITVRGFRAFGRDPQTIDCDGPLAVIFGRNSKGKSSLVEGIEFLLTGKTTRVQLHVGSSSEFAECLRNVHLDASEEVYVEAVVEVNGARSTVRRSLEEDLSSSGKCKGVLSIEGRIVPGVETIGLALSPPPFETPVLMQHAVRFVLSTKPQSRADYLKAVLDISDLDEVREVIAAQVKGLHSPSTPTKDRLVALENHPVFGGALKDLDLASAVDIQRGLAKAIRHLVNAPEETGLGELVCLLEAELKSRKQAIFPSDDLRLTALPTLDWPTFESVTQLTSLKKPTSLEESPAVRQLLEAVLAVPHIDEASEAIDCPVCLSREALTPGRMREIRDAVTGDDEARRLRCAAKEELDSARGQLESLVTSLSGEQPRAICWTAQEREEQTAAAERLLPREGADALVRLMELAENLREPRNDALHQARTLRELVDDAFASFQAGRPVDPGVLENGTKTTDALVDALSEARRAYSENVGPFLSQVDTALSAATITQGWAELLGLVRDYEKIVIEHRESRAHGRLMKEVSGAQRAIDRARAELLDTNFESLSDEIGRWWRLLRPDEPIKFSKIKRRGAGIRHVDLTALLCPEPTAVGVERHAAGVFSDSQLNALGLSVFLARAMRAGTGFVVLDDPVPASDDEHRGQFARAVIEELLNRGVQVILTTHDKNLNKRVHDLHGHVGIDGYEITMDAPGAGASLIRRTDDLRSLLDEADDFTRHCLDSQLPDAANKVRKAAERLCKEIVVSARRADGDEVTTADLNDNPAELVKMATPFLGKDAAHPGKLRHAITVTNPGSHDDPASASRQDLRGVMGDLKSLRRDYCI